MTAPAIATQPLSQRVKIGDPLSISVIATGTAVLHYSWKLGAIDIGTDLASFSIADFDYANEGNYTVTVSNADGSAVSNAAIIKSMPGQFNETYLQRKLFDWIGTILDLWDGASTRDPAEIAFIWHMQDMPRYATPLLMGRISAVQRIGRDVPFMPDNSGARRGAGIREFMLYLQFFGAGAIDSLSKIVDATDMPEMIASLQEDGITPVECHDVLDAHVFLDTMPEERAMLDIRFRTTSEWSHAIDVVESAEVTGEINEIDEVTINA
jgi:hypothetical protein